MGSVDEVDGARLIPATVVYHQGRNVPSKGGFWWGRGRRWGIHFKINNSTASTQPPTTTLFRRSSDGNYTEINNGSYLEKFIIFIRRSIVNFLHRGQVNNRWLMHWKCRVPLPTILPTLPCTFLWEKDSGRVSGEGRQDQAVPNAAGHYEFIN